MVILSLHLMIGCGGCQSTEEPPVDPDRGLYEEIFSDCNSFLLAWVRDSKDLEVIAGLDIMTLDTVSDLQEALARAGVEVDLSMLRWREIGERRGEEVDEHMVVRAFQAAATNRLEEF